MVDAGPEPTYDEKKRPPWEVNIFKSRFNSVFMLKNADPDKIPAYHLDLPI